MATLHPKKLPKPKPYDFDGERDRIELHDSLMATARDNQGGRNVCPYCYQPPMGTARYWRCNCGTGP